MLELVNIEETPAHEKNKSKDLIDALVEAVANLVESENPIFLQKEGSFERFPVWGSMRAPSGKAGKPKPPVEEKQLVEPDFGKRDNIRIDP